MMFKGGSSSSQGDLNGFLDAGSRMSGTLRFDDTFRIDGQFEGKIEASGDLIVGEGGQIEAEITARRVFISGTVRGSIHARERLEITAAGQVVADIRAPSLSIEDGACFEGRCTMERPGSEGNTASKTSGATVAQMPLPKEGQGR